MDGAIDYGLSSASAPAPSAPGKPSAPAPTATPAATRPGGLEDPSLYINRELSWLDFNDRVLQLAEDDDVPLLERVKFCAIYTTNLDEYYMVRVAGLQDQIEAGVENPSQ